ncbi:MAG TPA: Na+/H+ antiporter NhaA [Actinomycetes bacterium]|nr:Na+/H+ antiporter NhaA [Actinomycetes bacterium]
MIDTAPVVRRVVDPLKEFLHAEAASGLVLLAATGAAVGWANSPLANAYEALWGHELTLGFGPVVITENLRQWVNDGLITLFFFVVGLEIKRELVTGEMREPRRAALPALAALGGMVVPAAVFLLVNADGQDARGWGIPIATDTAFALGVLALLGSRVPTTAKMFLLALAIVDDIFAITVVAVFYSGEITVEWLAIALSGVALVVVLRWFGVCAISAYLPLGLLVWAATLHSGVHATIAGVAFGLLTPARPVRGRPVLEQLERRLHPVSSYLVVPVFALANAGVLLNVDALRAAVASPVARGVALGLLVGKVIGITGASVAAVRLRIGTLPEGLTIRHVVGLAALAGIGFTVSLFVAELAYAGNGLIELAKVGILVGSLVSGMAGAALLMRTGRPGGGVRPGSGEVPARLAPAPLQQCLPGAGGSWPDRRCNNDRMCRPRRVDFRAMPARA